MGVQEAFVWGSVVVIPCLFGCLCRRN